AGSVGDEDAAASAGGDVHIVVANSDVGDDAKFCRGAQCIVADALGGQADKALFVLKAAEKIFFWRTLLLGPELAVADRLEEGLGFGIERVSDENFGFRHGGSCLWLGK